MLANADRVYLLPEGQSDISRPFPQINLPQAAFSEDLKACQELGPELIETNSNCQILQMFALTALCFAIFQSCSQVTLIHSPS